MTIRNVFILFFSLGLTACTQNNDFPVLKSTGAENGLYALTGKEYQVRFSALYRSNASSVEDLNSSSVVYNIKDATKFLFGPLTNRDIGGIQKGEKINPLLDKAYLENGRVVVPYDYQGTWMVHQMAVTENTLRLPLPYSVADLRTSEWQNCTDKDEDHRTWDFFWYFWDPARPGCDHRLNEQYQEIEMNLSEETLQADLSFPEYSRMIHDKDGVPTLSMTFAFGYVKDVKSPNPFFDNDYGMSQFQYFYLMAKSQLLTMGFMETPIRQKDIIQEGSTMIGSKFVGRKKGVQVVVNIVAAAGVDQMDLFAHSYAVDHDGFFGWFGHSRVGSGFDAQDFEYRLRAEGDRYSLTKDYQLIYWAGCNSYSYYTIPFFELKAQLEPEADPNGTRNLDIISNTLPSLFAFNASNAQTLFRALINWHLPTSYQKIIQEVEKNGKSWGKNVIVNVLGDEDNSNQN